MKWIRLTIVGFALSNVGALGFVIYAHLSPPQSPLRYVEVQTWSDWNSKSHITDAAECLVNAEAWFQTLPKPSLKQRWHRRYSAKNALRMPDYEVVLVYEDGHREEVEVWVEHGWGGKISIRHNQIGYFIPEQPFWSFVDALRNVPL